MPNAAPTKADILKLEISYWEAMKAKDGRETSALSGNPSIVCGQHGVMSIDRDRMAEMTKSGDWELLSYAFENVEFNAPVPDVAIIAYTVQQTVRMKGEEKAFRAADISTWVRSDGGWACHAHGETILKD